MPSLNRHRSFFGPVLQQPPIQLGNSFFCHSEILRIAFFSCRNGNRKMYIFIRIHAILFIIQTHHQEMLPGAGASSSFPSFCLRERREWLLNVRQCGLLWVDGYRKLQSLHAVRCIQDARCDIAASRRRAADLLLADDGGHWGPERNNPEIPFTCAPLLSMFPPGSFD